MPRIMEIFEDAKKYMREHGNRNQWNGAYPEESLIREEIGKEHCYVIEDSDRITDAGTKVIATFCFIPGIDPTYDIIYDGHWLNDEPYGTIHRLASDGSRHGIGKACIDFCGRLTRNLRADTHKDNLTMQNLLEGWDSGDAESSIFKMGTSVSHTTSYVNVTATEMACRHDNMAQRLVWSNF